MTVTTNPDTRPDDLAEALAAYESMRAQADPNPLEVAKALGRVSAAKAARRASDRPAHGMNFRPPAEGVGHKATDALIATARELAAAAVAANRAVGAAERALTNADARRVDVRAAAAARAAGEPDPPSVLPALAKALADARTEDEIAQSAMRQSRSNARAAILENGPAIVAAQEKAAAASDAKARHLIEQALAELAVGAHARGIVRFVERPDNFQPAEALVPVGGGDSMSARNLLELLAQQLG